MIRLNLLIWIVRRKKNHFLHSFAVNENIYFEVQKQNRMAIKIIDNENMD